MIIRKLLIACLLGAMAVPAACARESMPEPEPNPVRDWSGWQGDVFIVNRPEQVEDCILRCSDMDYRGERFWTAWNFGASQTLDAGYAIAMWNMWRGHVLVRFDLRGVACGNVAGATFRIYAPRNITQVSSGIPVAVFPVLETNASWREGSSESLPDVQGASWLSRGDGHTWAGGMNGCGVAGVDYAAQPLGVCTASKYDGQWLEYDIPAESVRQWLEHPEQNAGLIVRVDQDDPQMGDHVLFYSSEHASGKGPELIVYGEKGVACTAADPAKKYNPRYVMPVAGSRFESYLIQDKSRYPVWTQDPVIGLTDNQRIYPYYWDMVVDAEYVLPYAYYPLSLSTARLDELMAAGDTDALRQWHIDRLKYLHLWEYVREQRWYDCGDIIEFLTPRQAALIWLGSKADNGTAINGVLNKVHPKGTPNLTASQVETRMKREWEEISGKVKMTSAQKAVVEPFIREMERQRCVYYNLCNTAAQRVHALLADPKVGDRYLIDALSEFMNYHDVYLYYDSYFQIKRCAFLLDNTDPVSFSAFWKEQKYNEYSPERVARRFADAVKYWPEDRPAIGVENKNNYW